MNESKKLGTLLKGKMPSEIYTVSRATDFHDEIKKFQTKAVNPKLTYIIAFYEI